METPFYRKAEQAFLRWVSTVGGRGILTLKDGQKFRVLRLGVHDLYNLEKESGEYVGRFTASQCVGYFLAVFNKEKR